MTKQAADVLPTFQHQRALVSFHQVNVESVDEAVSYVLALGASVAVISPKKVREAVAAAARAIAEIYES